MQVSLAQSDQELEKIADTLLLLRSSFERAALLAQIREQQRRCGYEIAYVESDGQVICVAGFVVGLKLAWGKHLYVDDLVTAELHRSHGAAAAMIDWLKSHARRLGCSQLHLDSGVQNFGAHRFYLREGFNISSHHFALKELSTP